MSGTVKFFNSEKGYGFIVPSDGSTDIFFYYSDVVDDGWPQADSKVTYDIGQNKRGPCAKNIKVLG